MNAIRNVLTSTWREVGFASETIGYTVSFGRSSVTPRAVLAAGSQLAVYKERIGDNEGPRSLFSAAFRVLWVSRRRTHAD